ncbi:AbiJ-NTD4 domain-containing protein [Candidatus Deferrimicrobium sp.]|uniref:AbiJ-NTD4 domain-containing protein n=1 Tax=Candidatus Deferrimicrobium sp. TaxID=3060586 RepID=UPI002ED5C6BC
MGNGERDKTGSQLRNSLWNLLFRVLSSTDFARIAWTTVLRGACLFFFKEPIDELPLSDNDASRLALKDRFFGLPDHRVYDLFEFFLVDDHGGLKEMDRKLIRRGLNELLEREGSSVRLYHDRFRPYQDILGFDEVAQAEESVRLFDMAAAKRHMETAVAYLSRRPEPESRGAIREAVLAVAAVAREVASREIRKGGEEAPLVVGSVAHAASSAGIPAGLVKGIDLLLRRAHALSGLPVDGVISPVGEEAVDPREAHFLVVFASSLIVYLKR